MSRWQITFTKKISLEFNAHDEDDAMIEASKIDLDSIPLEWQMDPPIELEAADLVSNTEFDSFGRPIHDIDEDEEY
jgi:hypothetical protein